MNKFSGVRFAVRVSVIIKLMSELVGLLALLTLVPMLCALAAGSLSTAGAYVGVIVALGALWGVGRRFPAPSIVQTNEAVATVALLFVMTSLLMAMPIMTYGVGFIDAWFEAVSGVTTTGLSTLDLNGKPWSFLFARGWMQWIGGVGVVVLALALFIVPGSAAKRLGFSKQETANTVGGTRAHAKRVIQVYVVLTVIGIALLLLSGSNLLDAIVHCMAALSTGGFANYADSLAGLGVAQVMVINLLCFAGAISFHVYYLSVVLAGRGGALDSQFYGLLATITALVGLVFLLGWLAGDAVPWLDAVTLVVSAQTTAGFATVDIASVPFWFMILLTLAMCVGGGIGSTSGGIKLGRVLFILNHARAHIMRAAMPARVYTGKRLADTEQLQDVLAVLFCFVAVQMISWMLFVVAGYPPVESLFEVTSALSTAGLSAGITHADLPTYLKVVLCVDMLFGRVEVVALLIVLMPRTWIGRRRRYTSA